MYVSLVLGDRIYVEALLRDGTLVWLGTPHMEGHPMRENPDLLETKSFVAPGALGLIPNHIVCTL